MAITGPSTYIPTTNEFLAHWALVNSALGASPLTLANGSVSLATLTGLRDDLQNARTTVVERINTVQYLAATLAEARAALLGRLEQILARIRANAPGSKWTRMLPLMPGESVALPLIVDALNDAANVWELYNGEETEFTLPAELPAGYTHGNFVAEIAALNTASMAQATAAKALQSAREDRNGIQDEIRRILRDYRQAVPSHLMPDSPLLNTLPRLTPERGRTPEPVQVEISFDSETNEAVIVWVPSSQTDVKHYSIRWSPGEEVEDYSTEDEEVVGSVQAGEPPVFRTTKGLLQPGSASLFRVCTVNETDNEKGSAILRVVRPET